MILTGLLQAGTLKTGPKPPFPSKFSGEKQFVADMINAAVYMFRL